MTLTIEMYVNCFLSEATFIYVHLNNTICQSICRFCLLNLLFTGQPDFLVLLTLVIFKKK